MGVILSGTNILCPKCGHLAHYSDGWYYCSRIECGGRYEVGVDVINATYKENSAALSNLFNHKFTIDGVKCESMEGFLRCLAVDDINDPKGNEIKKIICTLWGLPAYKLRYLIRDWRPEQTLFWQGKEIKRDSEEYTLLITRAFDCLFENPLFEYVLSHVKNKILIHVTGDESGDIRETLLTPEEYTYQLNRLLAFIKPKE